MVNSIILYVTQIRNGMEQQLSKWNAFELDFFSVLQWEYSPHIRPIHCFSAESDILSVYPDFLWLARRVSKNWEWVYGSAHTFE